MLIGFVDASNQYHNQYCLNSVEEHWSHGFVWGAQLTYEKVVQQTLEAAEKEAEKVEA